MRQKPALHLLSNKTSDRVRSQPGCTKDLVSPGTLRQSRLRSQLADRRRWQLSRASPAPTPTQTAVQLTDLHEMKCGTHSVHWLCRTSNAAVAPVQTAAETSNSNGASWCALPLPPRRASTVALPMLASRSSIKQLILGISSASYCTGSLSVHRRILLTSATAAARERSFVT